MLSNEGKNQKEQIKANLKLSANKLEEFKFRKV